MNSNLDGSTPVAPFGGQLNFTAPAGQSGNFWDLSPNQRNGVFAVDVLGASAVTAPGITSPQTLPAGTVGTPYSTTLTVQSGPGVTYTWIPPASGLPPGLTLSASGVLSGNPGAAATYTFVVTATDGVQPISQTETVVIGAQAGPVINPLVISQSAASVDVAAGAPVNVTFSASGGVAPYSSTSGAVPPGLTFSNGTLSGSRIQPGNFLVSVRVTAKQNTASTTVAVNVLGLSSSALPNGVAGQFYSASISANGGTQPYTYSASGLPAGLALSSGGSLTGTVKTAGNYSFSVTVSDGGGVTLNANFSVGFSPAQPLTISNGQLPSGAVTRSILNRSMRLADFSPTRGR